MSHRVCSPHEVKQPCAVAVYRVSKGSESFEIQTAAQYWRDKGYAVVFLGWSY